MHGYRRVATGENVAADARAGKIIARKGSLLA